MLVDVIVRLDEQGNIRRLEWYNEVLRREWLMLGGNSADEVFAHLGEDSSGTLWWNSERFLYERLKDGGDGAGLMLRQEDRIPELFRKAMDQLEDGIQIYDANARLRYINTVSKKISGFLGYPYPVEGERLMSLYQVTDESSTVLTTIRTKRPLINRFAKFLSATGKTMITCNTGYPLYGEDGEFLGVVALEQDVNVLRKKMERQEKISLAMEQQITTGLYAKNPSGYTFEDYVGSHPKVQEVVALAQSVSAKESNVLLLGETGTGKEIFAQSIHQDSLRSKKKFVAINCAAVPEQLVESILFGTEKGSFTGSLEKPGLFEDADGGTVFLDELNSMSLSMQSKLLRVLQERVFRRVGGNREIRANARVIASCNEDPFLLIKENKLRRDLFYRVATIMIHLPPLREHLDDMEALIWHRIRHSKVQYALPFTQIDPEVIWVLQQYSWPGNVRELNHVVDYAMTVSDDEVLLTEHLPAYILDAVYGPAPTGGAATPVELAVPVIEGGLQKMVKDYEDRVVQQALRQTGGNVSRAAELLGVKRQSLQYRLRRSKEG